MKAKTILAALMITAGAVMAGAPPINLDVDSNWQQLQPLRALEVQQGANAELRIRPKIEGAWVDLSGVTARFDARVNMTTSAAYQASSDLTTNAAHYIRIPLTTVQTGSALTNYIYSIVLLSGGNQYPLGTGSWNVVASGFAGASSIQTSTVAATTIQLDAEIAARIAGDAALSNYVAAATGALSIAAGSWTAGTGLTNLGSATSATGALSQASIASLARADSAVQPNSLFASNVALRVGTNGALFESVGAASTNVQLALEAMAVDVINAITWVSDLQVWQELCNITNANQDARIALTVTGAVGIASGAVSVSNRTIYVPTNSAGSGATPSLQDVVNVQAGAATTNLPQLDGGTWAIGANGRMVRGRGMSLTNISEAAFGAQQSGYNFGGTMTMLEDCLGSQQGGYNQGIMTMGGDLTVGARQFGYNLGVMAMGNYAMGAQQSGRILTGATATNDAIGAMQLFDLTNGQSAVTTTNGAASLLLGAGTVSNRNSIVAGDGQASHGDGSITAGGGFFGNGSGLSGLTPSQIAGAGGVTNGGIQINGAPFTNGAAITVTSGTSTSDVQNIAWTSQRVPMQITSASTVTVLAAWGNLMRLDVTNASVVITAEAAVTNTAYTYDATLELYAGTNTIAWVTGVFTNTTLLDISTTGVTVLNLNKPQRNEKMNVRQ